MRAVAIRFRQPARASLRRPVPASPSLRRAAVVPSPAKLAFSVQPTNALTQATITPAVQVVVEDSSGNVVTNATNPVTLALSGGVGLAGTLSATPQNGIATFSDLSVSTAGTYTLSATSTGLTSATSNSFTITAPGGGGPTAVKLAFLVQPSHALTGATITPAVQVVVEDANGNAVTSATNSGHPCPQQRHRFGRNVDRDSAEWCGDLQ